HSPRAEPLTVGVHRLIDPFRAKQKAAPAARHRGPALQPRGERSNQLAQDRRLAEDRCRAQPEHRGGGVITRRKRTGEPQRMGAVVISGDVTTQKPTSARVRLGSLALGLSALLLTAFPLVRPFFPLDPRSPGETLAVASPSITTARWVVAHHLAMVAFVLLP